MSKRFAFVYHNYCRYLNYQYALLEAHSLFLKHCNMKFLRRISGGYQLFVKSLHLLKVVSATFLLVCFVSLVSCF